MRCLPLGTLALAVAACVPLGRNPDPARAIEEVERIPLAQARGARLFTGPSVPRSGGELEVTFAVTAPGPEGLSRFEVRVWVDGDGDGRPGPDETLRGAERADARASSGAVLGLSIPVAEPGPLRFHVRAELTDGAVLERSGELERP